MIYLNENTQWNELFHKLECGINQCDIPKLRYAMELFHKLECTQYAGIAVNCIGFDIH